MARNTEILSVSITKEQGNAMVALGLSASQLLQDAVNQQIAASKNVLPQIKELELNILKLQEVIKLLFEFINFKEIPHSEYYSYVNSKQNVN